MRRRFHPSIGSRRSFFFGKKPDSDAKANDGTSAGAIPAGLNIKRIQEFRTATPDKQLETMRAALEMQKKMGKIPGIGFLANKNAEMMEKMLNLHEQKIKGKAVSPEEQAKLETEMKGFLSQQGIDPSTLPGSMSSPPPPPASSHRPSKGPTLDELKKINLGAEIEALFGELRTLRESKNSYRDKFNAREKECEDLAAEAKRLRESEEGIRKRLHLAEANVLLLNSENMELKENQKDLKQLRASNDKLSQRVATLQSQDAAPMRKRIEELEADVRTLAEANKSLLRKLERNRRRDPLLQFSQVCSSDPLRLCGTDAAAPNQKVEEAYQELHDAFEQEKAIGWKNAAENNARGARLMVAVGERVLYNLLEYPTLDAVVTYSGQSDAAARAFTDLGFLWTAEGDGRAVVRAPDGDLQRSIGPVGYAVAIKMAAVELHALTAAAFVITSVQAHVSRGLVENTKRSTIVFESSRSSSPGGQAANVSETQITAKLMVDGKFVYQSEAQDSRSAVANKAAATEKISADRRLSWNDVAPKIDKDLLLARMHTGGSDHSSTTALSEYIPLLTTALDAKQIVVAELALGVMLANLRKL